MRPDKSLNLIEDDIDVGDVGRYRGKSESRALAEILVVELCRCDMKTATRRVEEVT